MGQARTDTSPTDTPNPPPPTAVTAADLAAVTNPRAASGYACVYPHRKRADGVTVYYVRVDWCHAKYRPGKYPDGRPPKAKTVSDGHPTPGGAAAELVRHLRRRYGPGWAKAFAARKKNPFRIKMARFGNFRADVWVRGQLVSIGWSDAYPGKALPPGHSPHYWPHRPAARAAVIAYARRVLRRAGVLNPRDAFWRPD